MWKKKLLEKIYTEKYKDAKKNKKQKKLFVSIKCKISKEKIGES